MTLKVASLIEPCVKEVRAYFSNAKELMWKQMIKALYISLIINHSIRYIVIIGPVGMPVCQFLLYELRVLGISTRPSYKFIYKNLIKTCFKTINRFILNKNLFAL